MKKVVLSLCAVFMMAASVAAVSLPDPADYILVAYRLTPFQESQFSNTNGAESAFWKFLYNNPIKIDYMLLKPSTSARSNASFDDEADAQLSVWAAYGTKGLYLYYKVMDDNWVDAQTLADWANDAVDFFLDGDHSSDELYADPTLFYYMKLTKSMVQYQFNFGGREAPTTFRYSKLDPTWDAATGSLEASVKYERKSFAEGEGMGLFMEAFDAGDDVHRIQEWLVPWNNVSNIGIAMPSVNDKIAAVFGYNDVDGDMTEGTNQLRWRRADPWGLDNCWGDIEFGETLEHHSSSLAVLNPNYKSNARNGKVLGSEFYSVIGKKLPVVNGKVVAPRNSIVIERQLTSTGIKAVQFLAK